MRRGKVTGVTARRSIHPYILYGTPGRQDFPGVFFETAEKEDAVYGLFRLLNRMWAEGKGCAGIQAQLLLPASAEEPELKEIMKGLWKACGDLGLQLWNAEVSVRTSVERPQLILAGFPEKMEKTGKIPCEGLQLVQIGPAACEGTLRLLGGFRDILEKRFCRSFLEEAERQLRKELDKRQAAEQLRNCGASGIYAVSEGGIFTGLWEIAEKWKLGFEADLRKIPIRQETVEICEFLKRNPYCLEGNGCLLACAEDGDFLATQMKKMGRTAAVIGRMTGNKACILHNREEIRYLDRPAEDEIYQEETE